MVYYAADIKLPEGEAPVTNFLLDCISVLDNMGAWHWNLRLAGMVWFLFFAAIRHGIGKRRGVEWYALVHAAITGIGGIICSYLSFVMAEDLIGLEGAFEFVECTGAPIFAVTIHGIMVQFSDFKCQIFYLQNLSTWSAVAVQ